MRTSIIIALSILAMLLPPFPVFAEPSILLDDGGISTFEYRQILRPGAKVPDFGGQWVQKYSPLIQKNPKNLGLWLPLKTSRLTPRSITEEKRVNYPELDAPICIIGSDALSRDWLKTNFVHLFEARARCWLVQANSFDDFTAISKLLQGKILMLPADGNAIAEYFGIEHYPVFIDKHYISQ